MPAWWRKRRVSGRPPSSRWSVPTRSGIAAREDFRQQSRQSTGSPPAAAPLYNDAMQMAIQGHDATTIAH
ncbi:hypothetical protein, partial [Accumulibacter sp.]|uniref:hypothetical protein n=1 Tax=Accumulibacter sp. TaxID=2053492 RepID=UPI00258EEBE2